jgi:uncharacterized membrane protein YuzA (DUF378 family)
MAVTLPPRTYFLVDWGSKLVGMVAIAAALQHLFGSLSVPVGVVGLLVGIATVFVEVETAET